MEEGGSSAQASSQAPTSNPQTILLHVLSPSVEVPNKLTFSNVPISTTVGELKTKICNAVSTRPSPDRQRLIYGGKALVQETATLKDIFSQEKVRCYALGAVLLAYHIEQIDKSEALSLHLVLPPAGPTQIPRSSTASVLPNTVAGGNSNTPGWWSSETP